MCVCVCEGWAEFKIKTTLVLDDLKLFGKSYEPIDSLVQTVHTLSIDIGMEFGIRKVWGAVTKTWKIC